ncbi:MAG: PASTA domain-containing protein [Paludibacteraceae bacterium]|nr:PASTA domain-containing protein [Paludibacteraceae bacterium]MBR4815314.1 PASTA domain-containing protein [Paludibacteraceae bacterium]
MKISAKKIFINPYTISIVAALLILFVIYKCTFSWLKSYTNHDQEIVVPDLSGMTTLEASQILQKQSLKLDVVDSVFMKGKALGAIVEQTPKPGEKIKADRTIYLIVNSSAIRKVVLPDVHEFSLRQAEAMINSVGLKVDSVIYIPNEYKDLVQYVKQNKLELQPGTRIPEGSSVTLYVGRGLSNETLEVVSFRKLNEEQAILKAHSAYLNIGKVIYDEQPKDDADKALFFVYKQQPATGSTINVGGSINLYLSKDPSTLESPEEIYYNPEEPDDTSADTDNIFK